MNVGEKIREERKKKKLTQKQLAELTGIAEITIRKYEGGKFKPKNENLNKIASALNVDAETLQPYTRIDLFDHVEKLRRDPGESSDTIRFWDELQETIIIGAFRELNQPGKEKAAQYIDDLTKIPEYRKDYNPEEK